MGACAYDPFTIRWDIMNMGQLELAVGIGSEMRKVDLEVKKEVP